MKDLFETPDKLPKKVQRLFTRYFKEWRESYDECRSLLIATERLGYTFDYYLDAIPYNLRKK